MLAAVLASLIVRNVLRNRRRLLPLAGALIVTFLVLVVGNGVLASSDEALYNTFSSHISGDLSVASAEGGAFTLFGSESLLVGEYHIPPTLLRFDELDEVVRELPGVRATAPAITSIARIEVRSRGRTRTILGVDFERYREMFPDLEIVAGDFPEAGERGVMVQPDYGERAVGSRATLSAAHDLSFTVREAPVTGVFRFPVQDELLDNVILVDAETARALNGYVYGAGGTVDIPEAEREAFASDFDDLFGDADTFEDEDAAAGVDDADAEAAPATSLEELESFFRETAGEAAADRATAEGAWNFLLIAAEERGRIPEIGRRIEAAGFDRSSGFLVRDWRGTVGGNADIAWYLQLMFNVGVLFVAAGAAMITTNALVLSVLERTAEIGTMRALGATRARVSLMIALETVLVVVGSALVGTLLGMAASALLNAAGVTTDNPYISILFGGQAISSRMSAGLLAAHVGAGFALALFSVVYPLKRALGIAPVEAMSE